MGGWRQSWCGDGEDSSIWTCMHVGGSVLKHVEGWVMWEGGDS